MTKPTIHMGEAMLQSCVSGATGDDVMREDTLIDQLEATVARLLGKEAGVFVPTCTMANLLAIGSHCGRGDEVLVGSESHIYIYEQGGASWLMGVPFHVIPNSPADGTLPLAAVEAALRMRGGGADPHHPSPRLVCIENTANRCGGLALPVEYMDALGALARAHGVALHCDGARILNAATALGCAPAALVAACDSVSLCLSKGLGAPLGAVLVGAAPLVERARRLRKAVGGGMRQAGVVAAACLVALEDHAPGLAADHARARAAAAGLARVPGLLVQERVDSNIVYFALGQAWSVGAWRARAQAAAARGEGAVAAGEGASLVSFPVDALGAAAGEELSLAAAFIGLLRVGGVKVGAYGTTKIRIVTHHQVSDEHVERLVRYAAAAAAVLA